MPPPCRSGGALFEESIQTVPQVAAHRYGVGVAFLEDRHLYPLAAVDARDQVSVAVAPRHSTYIRELDRRAVDQPDDDLSDIVEGLELVQCPHEEL